MIDVWLVVVLTGWATECILLGMTSSRFTVVWYVGRLVGLFASSLVLALLISESTKLYSRLAIAAAGRARDREGKRMTLEVLIESIAHEMHQPLSAVIVNSDAALRLLDKDPADIAEVRAALADIANGRISCRADHRFDARGARGIPQRRTDPRRGARD